MTDLDALRARVGAATGPDSKLDFDLWVALVNGGKVPDVPTSQRYLYDAPFTAFIDAALALVERLLPGFPREWAWRLFTIPGAPPEVRYEASVFKPWRGAAFDWRKSAPTAPLAILAALLAALPASTKEMNDV